MPSKEVLSAAAHRFQARHDDRLVGDLPEVDLDAVVERKDDHTLDWAGHRRRGIEELAEHDDVEFIHDTARFVDDWTIAVGDREIEADYVVVATGSVVNVPDLPGIKDVDYLTSADVLDATELPDSGIVMGFGYVGMELVPYRRGRRDGADGDRARRPPCRRGRPRVRRRTTEYLRRELSNRRRDQRLRA